MVFKWRKFSLNIVLSLISILAIAMLHSDLRESLGKDEVTTAEMKRRLRVVREVCKKYQVQELTKNTDIHDYHEHIHPVRYLVSAEARTIYCYAHKVASSTWMGLYTNIYPDQEAVKELKVNGSFYRIKKFMGIESKEDLRKLMSSGNYFSFYITRHPFVRILSAFRDRILNGKCSGQAKRYVEKIFEFANASTDNLKDSKGCVTRVPSFQQFLEFVVQRHPHFWNEHWKPISQDCSPCLFNYSAIVKLETASIEQDFVMRQSGLAKLAKLEMKHKTRGGETRILLKEFYSKISCSTLRKLEQGYRVDLEMYEYDTKLFYLLCIKD